MKDNHPALLPSEGDSKRMDRRGFAKTVAGAALSLTASAVLPSKAYARSIDTSDALSVSAPCSPSQNVTEQTFSFHADADSLSGAFDEPLGHIPEQASISLPTIGGLRSRQSAEFAFEGILSARSTYTHVAGTTVQKYGPWTGRVTSVVENLNILGRITADRLVASIFMQHPVAGGLRKVSFAGTSFENLRIDGKPITLTLNSVLLPAQTPFIDPYDESAFATPEIEWSSLWQTAYSQSRSLIANSNLPQWAADRYGWIAAKQTATDLATQEGYAICPLVNKIDGLADGQSFGHFIELPDLGRIFLGEATIYPKSVSLTAVRAELSSTPAGQVSAATAASNGSTCPPGD